MILGVNLEECCALLALKGSSVCAHLKMEFHSGGNVNDGNVTYHLRQTVVKVFSHGG